MLVFADQRRGQYGGRRSTGHRTGRGPAVAGAAARRAAAGGGERGYAAVRPAAGRGTTPVPGFRVVDGHDLPPACQPGNAVRELHLQLARTGPHDLCRRLLRARPVLHHEPFARSSRGLQAGRHRPGRISRKRVSPRALCVRAHRRRGQLSLATGSGRYARSEPGAFGTQRRFQRRRCRAPRDRAAAVVRAGMQALEHGAAKDRARGRTGTGPAGPGGRR